MSFGGLRSALGRGDSDRLAFTLLHQEGDAFTQVAPQRLGLLHVLFGFLFVVFDFLHDLLNSLAQHAARAAFGLGFRGFGRRRSWPGFGFSVRIDLLGLHGNAVGGVFLVHGLLPSFG